MRRIAVATLILAALAGAYWACSTDAPTPTRPNQGGGPKTGPSPLLITLFTTNANPTAGSCTLIQAIVTFNGQAVADGTGVSFSTDFGTFAQNSSPVVSIVTTKGSAIATLCSNLTGTAFVNASATVNGVTAKADALKIVFQPSAFLAPFFSSCSPSFGPNTGGTALTINGGRFLGDASTTRATFTAAGVTREALVTSVSSTAVVLQTPAFPEATAPSVPVSITLTFFANSSSPITLAVPNCFAYGTASSSTPTVSALLPSSGSNDGGTLVSIIGSGFSAPLQVFFGPAEAQVVSVTFNQIVAVSPRASTTAGTANATVQIRVHEVNSGIDGTFTGFRYTEPVQIISWTNNFQPVDMAFTTVTIYGRGFQAPVAVDFAGVAAIVTSVSATEIQAIPGVPVFTGCSDISGAIAVTNINTGDGTTGGSFTYQVVTTTPVITNISPSSGDIGTVITITGSHFAGSPSGVGRVIGVQIGSRPADGFTVLSDSQITAVVPDPGTAPPACPPGVSQGTLEPAGVVDVTLIANVTGCTAKSTGAFLYRRPCTTAPTPTPTP